VSFDTPADNKAFRDKYEFGFPLLSDTTKAMAVAYGAATDTNASHPARAACVIRADGTVHRWWPNVDARGFADSVLGELP